MNADTVGAAQAHEVKHQRWTSTSTGPLGAVTQIAPGFLAAALIAAAAMALARVAPVVGAPVIAIVGGILVTLVRTPAATLRPGIGFAAKRVLQGSVVVLGLELSLQQVLNTGVSSLPVLLGTLALALVIAQLAGRALRLGSDLRVLIGNGTAICGASAIAATDAVINAEEADVSYAIATIFIFNVIAVLLYPTIGHALGLSQHSFGLWSGTAINDVSSVVAASTAYGHSAAAYGVIVKLTRTLAIIPISVALATIRGYRRERSAEAGGGTRLPLRQLVPFFIIAFLAAVTLNTVGAVPLSWHAGFNSLATWMITIALAAIGLSTNVAHMRRAGLRPLALGAILWASVGLGSLGLQALTGTL